MLKLEPRKDELLAMYNSGFSIYKIAKEIGEYEQAVTNLLKKYVELPKKKDYSINESYFKKIDSVDKAYFFGLIAADGAIVEYKPNKFQMTISLQSRDKSILELMKESTKADVPVREYAQSYRLENGTIFKQARFVTGNQTFCAHLINHGITPNKSKTLIDLIPEVNQEFIPDFIRGYFDGDGSIYQTITSGTKLKNYVSFRGTEDLLSGIKEYLSIEGGKVTFGSGSSAETGCFEWKFGAVKDILYFKDVIYHENVGNFYLSRKKEKFLG